MLVTVVLVGLLGQIFVQSVACDGPLTPKGKGNAVVEKVVDMITNLKIFPSDHKFLCREAWVESKYGKASGTYWRGYYGGIFNTGKLKLVPFPALFQYNACFVLSGEVLTIVNFRNLNVTSQYCSPPPPHETCQSNPPLLATENKVNSIVMKSIE